MLHQRYHGWCEGKRMAELEVEDAASGRRERDGGGENVTELEEEVVVLCY